MRLTGTTQPRAAIAVVRVAFEVTFGEATGTTAGELLRLPYTSTEPLAAAQLILPDGRHLELTVGDGVLSVLLPPDTPYGWAAVHVVSELGSERTYPAVVLLQGFPVVVPEQPPAGLPRRRVPARRRLVSTRSRLVTTGSTVLLARRRDHATAVVASRSSLRAGLFTHTRTRPHATTSLRGELVAHAPLPWRARTAVTRERGSPSLETLIALDLI
jgi:hypothetical protein